MGALKDALLGDIPYVPSERAFSGKTYEPERDYVRLSGQLKCVYHIIKDGQWWTLRGLAYAAGSSEASVSARLRDLRKPEYGSYRIERRHVANGLFEYRMKS